MDIVLVPLIKDRKDNITSKDNYPPIAITCSLSKHSELLILDRIKGSISSRSNKFGYKGKHGKDVCMF